MKPVLLVLALVMGALGCTGSSALRNHSIAAQTLDDLGGVAKKTVLDMRASALADASEAAKKAGAPEPDRVAAINKAAAEFDAKPYTGSVNAFISAKDAYVRSVLVAAGKESTDWATLKPILGDVVKTYNAMRSALGNPSQLPAIPSSILDLLA